MATPIFIKFSRITGNPFLVLAHVQEAMARNWGSTIREVVQLRPSQDAYDGGLELAGDFLPCDSVRELRTLAGGWREFAVVYVVRDVPAECYLYVFGIDEADFGVTAAVDSSLVWYRNDDYPEPGKWFEGFLITIATAFEPAVCGYGRDDAYRIKHESIDANAILDNVRDGKLLTIPQPVFHAIRRDLIDKDEIDALMKTHRHSPTLVYRQSPKHHVLADI
jgi:hypothetical protein